MGQSKKVLFFFRSFIPGRLVDDNGNCGHCGFSLPESDKVCHVCFDGWR